MRSRILFARRRGREDRIRFADGREVPSAEYLLAELARLRARAP
jgi:hypothetical protein